MTDDKPSAPRAPGWTLVPRFLVWLGGSAGAIGVVLSALGFLVEHAYFDRMGIPRTLYRATSQEYVVSGGKFLLGILPLALTGSLQFCQAYWWLVFAIVALGALIRWRSGSSNVRWVTVAICVGIAFGLLARRFELHGSPDYEDVSRFTFVFVAAIAFIYVDIFFTDEGGAPAGSISRYAFRFPLVALLVCALVALPYLRGYYALERVYPLVQFLAKDKRYFCDLSGSQNPQDTSCEQETWQIIDIGAERAILRRVADSRIYVVPAASLTTFRIVGKEQNR